MQDESTIETKQSTEKPTAATNEYAEQTARLSALANFVTSSMYQLKPDDPLIQHESFEDFRAELSDAVKSAFRAIKRIADNTEPPTAR